MDEVHHKAIIYRYEGKTFDQISDLIENKLSSTTLRQYFSRNGLLHDAYKNYEEEQNSVSVTTTRTMLQQKLPSALQDLFDLLERAKEAKKDYLILKIVEGY